VDTSRYSWNIAGVGIKHHSINQRCCRRIGKFCEFFNEKVKDYDHGVQESDCAVNSCTRIFPYIFHIKPGFFRGVVVVVIVW
jgi:hypothetical protein